MVILARHFTVTLLILLQLVAPLLHAHSGVELNHDKLHLPGLEKIDINFPENLQKTSSQDQIFSVVVNVCIGINPDTKLFNADSEELGFVVTKQIIPSIQTTNKFTPSQINSPPINQLEHGNLSRAPPLNFSS